MPAPNKSYRKDLTPKVLYSKWKEKGYCSMKELAAVYGVSQYVVRRRLEPELRDQMERNRKR